MKTQTFFSILTAIVLVLLLASGAGAYWLTTNRSTLEVAVASNSASVFIARQSPWVMSLLVNPDRLTGLQLQDTPPPQRRQVQRKWQKLQQALFAHSQLNYSQDIRPWLGNELTFAVTTADLDRDNQNGQQPGYLLVAAVKDAEQAQQSLQAYWQKRSRAGEELVFEQYAGVPLGYTTKKSRGKPEKPGVASNRLLALTSPVIATVSNQFVLFANHPKVLRDAINNLQVPELSLSTSETYQAALEQLNSPHIGVLFVQLPQLATWLQDTEQPDLIADLPDLANSATLSPSSVFESLVVGLTLSDRGMLGDAVLFPALEEPLLSNQPGLLAPVQALQYIPVESNRVAAGKDLAQLVTQLNSRLPEATPLKRLLAQPIDRLQQQLSIHLAEDLLPWITGDYAVAVLPGIDKNHPDWILVTQQSPETEAGIAQLDKLAQQQGMTLASFTLEDQPVTTWTKLSTTGTGSSKGMRGSISVQVDVKAAHTSLGNYEILATSLDAMKQAIGAVQQPLLTDTRFQTAVQTLPTPNRGYLYFNHPDLGAVWAKQFGKKPSTPITLLDLQPLLDQVQSITVSNSSKASTAQHSQIFLHLADDDATDDAT